MDRFLKGPTGQILISARVVAMDRSTVSKDMPSYRFFIFFYFELEFLKGVQNSISLRFTPKSIELPMAWEIDKY